MSQLGVLLGGGYQEPSVKQKEVPAILKPRKREISPELIKSIESFKKKFEADRVSKFMGDPSVSNTVETLAGKDSIKTKKESPSVSPILTSSKKIGKIDTAKYTAINEDGITRIMKNDGAANILAKMINTMKRHHRYMIEQREIESNFKEEQHEKEKRELEHMLQQLKSKEKGPVRLEKGPVRLEKGPVRLEEGGLEIQKVSGGKKEPYRRKQKKQSNLIRRIWNFIEKRPEISGIGIGLGKNAFSDMYKSLNEQLNKIELYFNLKPITASKPFTGTNKEYLDQTYQILLKEAKKQGLKNPEVIAQLGAAQSALETGYGKHIAPGSNNYFGIKDFSGGGVSAQTEEVVNGKRVVVRDRFRKYGSMEESAADYIAFLQENSRYRQVLKSQTIEEAIARQARSGYASASPEQYESSLRSIISRMATTSTQQSNNNKEYLDQTYQILLKEAKKQGLKNPEVIAQLGADQSALETGYGKHIAPGSNNYFGITEEVVNGKRVVVRDRFRKYGSMEESAADYIAFLQKNPRYRSGYATASPEQYESSLRSIISRMAATSTQQSNALTTDLSRLSQQNMEQTQRFNEAGLFSAIIDESRKIYNTITHRSINITQEPAKSDVPAIIEHH